MVHGIVEIHWYSCCGRIAIISENQTRCTGDDRVWGEFFDWVTGGR